MSKRQTYSERLLGKGRVVAWQRLARFRHAAKAVRKHLPASKRKDLLDIGAADGIGLPFLKPLAERMLSVNYYEDHTQEFRVAHPSDPVMTADARSLPLEDGAYDVVVSFETLHLLAGWGDRERAIREIYRVLRPGGLFVFSVPIETGFAALLKYFARRATGNELHGMTFGLALSHALFSNGTVAALDDGHQLGFSAARFVHLVATCFGIREQRPVPIRVLLPMNLLVVAGKQA
jgi:SAM-dependent methyltransferase